MAGIKSLIKDTAIYGVSSIVGRFLNWCLVPLYTAMFVPEEYGVVTNDERDKSAKVLRAAAYTYVAAAAASILQLLRLIMLFGGRRRDD